jgi:L-cysteine desulfidase
MIKGDFLIVNIQSYVQLLKKEMVVVMGCTEPAAAALAGGKSMQLLGCHPETVHIYSSRDMIKNAMGVSIPNSTLRGIQAAVCLGICGGNPDKGLNILSVVTDGQRVAAAELTRHTTLELVENVPPVYIKVVLECGGHSAVCVVAHQHDRFVTLVKDGVELLAVDDRQTDKSDEVRKHEDDLTVSNILAFANAVPLEDVSFVLQGAKTNLSLACHSMENEYGLTVGKAVLGDKPMLPRTFSDAVHQAAGLAAAGSDARMSGCVKEVVINSGSGNQGITCSVPVLKMAEFLNSCGERLTRALCVSQLIAISLTARKGRLSALCGAFTAAMGTSCGFVYLLGGGKKEMDMAIRSMVANLTGIVCDGAKQTCALKIFSCVEAAGLSCQLAFQGQAPGSESGIVGDDCEETIDHLSRISHEGMAVTDHTILSIMLNT